MWLQQKWLHKVISFTKVLGTNDTADLMTKPLGKDKNDEFITKHIEAQYRTGRAAKAVKLQGDVNVI